jgi:hypothetical protein
MEERVAKKMGRIASLAIAIGSFASIGLALPLSVGIGASGCSSSSSSNGDATDGGTAASSCVDSQCKPNNKCISTTQDRKCRFPCTKHMDCPFNYSCTANDTDDSAYCVANAKTFEPKATGQWGFLCKASGGIANNPDCDSAQGFQCFGVSPTDGAAFCTQYNCEADADCGAGFYCGTANEAPNVTTVKHSAGKTFKVCLPRTYCSPCTTDIDCGTQGGVPLHCVTDTKGANYCASECATDSNCQSDARCAGYGAFKACTPRAGVCVGDGSFCSPCHSDADCSNGICFDADYSNEKFCTVKSGVQCKIDTNSKLVSQCPSRSPGQTPVGCTYFTAFRDLPTDQCYGTVAQGSGADLAYVPGCYSKH